MLDVDVYKRQVFSIPFIAKYQVMNSALALKTIEVLQNVISVSMNQIHDRHYITSWFIRIKIYNRHHPESVQDFTVAAGKFCNVLQINVWMVYLDILI